jgi:hypothetical protein
MGNLSNLTLPNLEKYGLTLYMFGLKVSSIPPQESLSSTGQAEEVSA